MADGTMDVSLYKSRNRRVQVSRTAHNKLANRIEDLTEYVKKLEARIAILEEGKTEKPAEKPKKKKSADPIGLAELKDSIKG